MSELELSTENRIFEYCIRLPEQSSNSTASNRIFATTLVSLIEGGEVIEGGVFIPANFQ